ncbi:indoleamine 2,3-dioxygenase [Naviculisporaceae sp. PSN 640]
MGSNFGKGKEAYPTSFEVLGDPRPDDMSLPAFMVSTNRGFLPRMDPIASLPQEFSMLESILQDMPVKKADGEPGLLAKGELGDFVDKNLPDLTEHVDTYKDNLPLMNALFIKGELYGLGRQVLPANIARPIARCAELCDFKPFMEYAGSYALFNYKLLNPTKDLEYSNLGLIRAFEHGLHTGSSEAGFVLVHVDMVKNSGPLVKGTVGALDACQHQQTTSPTNTARANLNASLSTVLSSLIEINSSMEKMWGRSKPGEYTSFRTFIFGITSQSMFPNGVVYQGVGDDGEPKSFRGESGANDSMIPLMDNLLQIPMPDTPLTKILEDFRSYRPSNHRQFLAWVRGRSEALSLKEWALSSSSGADEEEEEEVLESRRLWLKILNQVRDFRWRHWCFAREYIIKKTSHPTATGGSPIVTWLPNQLQAVLDEMARLYSDLSKKGDLGEECKDINDLIERQRETLRKEVAKFCEERGVSGPAAVAA